MPYQRGKSVFKNHEPLDFDYVPEKLPHRELQMKRLFTLFSPIVDSNISQNAFLTGSTGTGKTVLSKKFCLDFQDFARSEGQNLRFVHVNCRKNSTENAVMLRVLNEFQPRFPDRGFSISEMLDILKKSVEKEKAHFLVVLDEIDILLKKTKSSDIIYHFTRFNDEVIGAKKMLSLILISQEDIFRLLDTPSISTFKRSNIIRLDKYTRDELVTIVEQRMELALHSDAADLGVSQLIADIASEEGDARYAIELLGTGGELADERREQIITAEHVREAKALTQPSVVSVTSKLTDLDRNRKLILMAIARSLKKETYTTTGDVEKRYAVICEEYEAKKLGHTQFWKYIKDLDAQGFIDAKKSSKGVVGTTTMISLPDIPAKVLEQKLMEIM